VAENEKARRDYARGGKTMRRRERECEKRGEERTRERLCCDRKESDGEQKMVRGESGK
jgi:hypothetical protein